MRSLSVYSDPRGGRWTVVHKAEGVAALAFGVATDMKCRPPATVSDLLEILVRQTYIADLGRLPNGTI